MNSKMKHPITFARVELLFLLLSFSIFSYACSSQTSSYYYAQKQIEHGDLSYHQYLKVNEYMNAFPQNEIEVPANQDLTLQVHSFSKNPNSKENKNLIQIAVKTRFPNSDIEAGLILGYSEMSKFHPRSTRRLILLTDGISNVNVHTPEEIAKKAKVQYLEGSRISTIGLGYDVNQTLLRSLAENGKGHYYFADNAKTLTKIIRDDFETLMIPIVREARLIISSNSGYKILHVYGGPENSKGVSDKIVLNLGELNANDWRIIVVEVSGKGEVYNPISAQITYSYPKGNGIQKVSADLKRETSNSNSQVNLNVARNSVIFSNAMSLIEIGKLAESEKYQDAFNLVNLQMNNNRILSEIDPTNSLDRELETLSKVRNILEYKIRMNGLSDSKFEAKSDEKKNLFELIQLGVSLTAKVIPGPWTLVAELFLTLTAP
ncbi:VWA domain-containing protein [Leptospira santarosai]|uniref:VWA domain-containing protein n=1 Tax=Leptospira santarosai TaxID=28183 RepID=UPI0002BF851D|nr:VWA domain-containing protein [Leptospira santarosai]EMO84383.1 von Willebrand factor type A domain protein [Leptospira santarosai str. AIM]